MPTNTHIPTLDGTKHIPAYVARPHSMPRGIIIVVQEIFRINDGIRRKVEEWAQAGYIAVAPDVFWRQAPGMELDPDIKEDFQKALSLMLSHDFVEGQEDMRAVLAWARSQNAGKVGLVGFCMGGRIAYETACSTDIDAAVGYYGVHIDQMLDKAGGITGRLMLHIPTEDGFVPETAQKLMHAALDSNPKVTLHDYPGLGHGFADTFGKRRDAAGAGQADNRTIAFFSEFVG